MCPVVSPVPFVLNVRGQSQKKDGSPSSRVKTEINFVKSGFSVDHCVCAPKVQSALNVANAKLVRGRLQNFWQKWSLLGANPRVVSILKDGYILPFKIRPPLVRDPLIISGYAHPLRNFYLKEALHALDSFSTVPFLLRFLARYRPDLRDRGSVKGTQTGISGTILYIYINSNLRKKLHIFQSQL